jgi:hypothetical protein
VRARIIPITVAGVLALTTGAALAETSPPDPEVVVTPVDDTTTTTAVEEPITADPTVGVPPETTTTTTVVVDEPSEVPEVSDDEVSEPEVRGDGATKPHPENHGLYVSSAAHGTEQEGNHGAAVSAVARSDAGKNAGGD